MGSLSFQALALSNQKDIRSFLTDVLAAQSTQVDFVRSVDKGLQNLNKKHYDLVIAQIKLDGQDSGGIELLRGLRKFDQDLPLILIGDQETISASVQVVNFGVSGFLSLPFDVAEVEETVSRAIRQYKSRFQKNQLVNYKMSNHYQVVIKSSEQNSLKLIDTVDNLIELVYPEEYGSFPDLKMAIYEGLTNAVDHGNKRKPGKNIYFQIHLKMDRILVQIKDEGEGFEADKNVAQGGDNMHRGLALINHLMDEVTFNHKGNEINFLKLLHQSSNGAL